MGDKSPKNKEKRKKKQVDKQQKKKTGTVSSAIRSEKSQLPERLNSALATLELTGHPGPLGSFHLPIDLPAGNLPACQNDRIDINPLPGSAACGST